MTWIQGQKGDAKKAGILAAVAKVPTLLRKLQASANAAIADPNARDQVGFQEEHCIEHCCISFIENILSLFKRLESLQKCRKAWFGDVPRFVPRSTCSVLSLIVL